MTVDPDLVDIALARVPGVRFEDFCNSFFPSLLGVTYAPLGGMHDGGADGFGGDIVHERSGRNGHFFQASIQADPKAKVRATIKRLREFGRQPKQLTYLTSRTVDAIDVVEDELSEEFDVVIRIRDGGYIRSQVNASNATIAAFEKYLRPELSYLAAAGSAPVITTSKYVASPAVFVFLRQEVDKLDGDVSLVNSITDSLAIWSLEGTDPDAGVYMSAQDALVKIVAQVPSARQMIEPRVQKRLEALSQKSYPGGRQVNWHRSENVFVLPHETRKSIEGENASDEALRLRVLRTFQARARALAPDGDAEIIARVTLRSFQLTFEQEGLEFAHFISRDNDVEYPQIGDSVRTAVAEQGIAGQGSTETAAACLSVARSCLYNSTEDERTFLGRLARTYTLLFTLSQEPRLIEYFETMANDFYLYVGSDMLVRALSERYLAQESQLVRNVLLMAARSGARLVLTEPVLMEVLWNLRSSDLEHKNHIEGIEHRLTRDMMREVPKILLRAYLYNRDEAEGPSNWPGFVEQFCTHGNLFKSEAETQLRRYLQAAFSMEYRSRADLQNMTVASEVSGITSRLMALKGKQELAENDALLACAVYGHRRVAAETFRSNEFGYKTWWLTNETRILRLTKELEKQNQGARYMMRPDFLLNFFSFAPSASEVRRTFENIFPSSLGVQLSRRMDEGTFRQIMKDVRNAEDFEDARREAVMAECADRLKSDFERRYRVELD